LEEFSLRVIFIRHGKTKGNIEKRYIGVTDEELSKEGIFELKKRKYEYPFAERIISSPLKRCVRTAEIIYNTVPEVYYNLRECSFGDFENKNYKELKNNLDYIKWLQSNGKMAFPNGESHYEFCERCCCCFENIIKYNKTKTIAFVIHGGTIMAILERYCLGSFYDWQIDNGDFISFEITLYKNNLLIDSNSILKYGEEAYYEKNSYYYRS